jgi:hypothetical protein
VVGSLGSVGAFNQCETDGDFLYRKDRGTKGTFGSYRSAKEDEMMVISSKENLDIPTQIKVKGKTINFYF